MNKIEFVKWQLEENVKKREELKIRLKEKQKEYLDEKSELESDEFVQKIEGEKQFLQKLQESQKKELDELKARHKKEKDEAMAAYLKSKDKVKLVLGSLKDQLDELIELLIKVNAEIKNLNKEKGLLKGWEDITISKHAIVQYLDRAKNMDIEKIRKEVRAKFIEGGLVLKPGIKIQDHAVVDHLVENGIIDLEKIEKDILPDRIKEVMLRGELVGSTGTYTIKDGFRVVAKNGNIVTFLPQPEKPKKKNKAFREKPKTQIRRMKL